MESDEYCQSQFGRHSARWLFSSILHYSRAKPEAVLDVLELSCLLLLDADADPAQAGEDLEDFILVSLLTLVCNA